MEATAVEAGAFEDAVGHLLRFGELKDELLDERTRDTVAGLEARYRF